MPLSVGDKLGPYEILAVIGEGGMGDVYKARDTRLDRTVAVKVAKNEFGERFEREARAVASLSHPNICTLHDVGPNFLVMEYIEGVPLKGPLPLHQALSYASQICDALDAAHKNGITHRDLKPANILVTKQGVKLLDFGLAKVESPVQASEASLTRGLTVKGQILGTLLYMSPEQVSGQDVDARSDIFSFGLVLYEMLTGKRAFEGSTPASVLAAIMERPAPSITDIAPAALDRVLKRCLEKDPESRWQSARDLKASLDVAASTVEAAPAQAAPGSRVWLVGVVAALVIAAAVFAGLRFGKRTFDAPPQTVRFQIPVQPSTGLRAIAAISPDGLSLAYFDVFQDGRNALKIRAMSSGTTNEFPAAEMAQPMYLFWSVDSKTIYFGGRRFLKQMDVARGTVKTICECAADSGTVNQDGVILLGSTPSNHEIARVSASGQMVTLRKAVDQNAFPDSPAFLPDGRRYLFVENNGLFLASLDRPEDPVRRLADAAGKFALVPGLRGSYVVLSQPTEMQALPFDAESATITGPPVTLPLGTATVAVPSGSQSGILLHLVDFESEQKAVWFDRDGKRVSDVAGAIEGYVGVDLSHDAGRLAIVDPNSKTSGGLRILDLARGTASKVAQQVRPQGSVVWSPDDTSVAFVANDKDRVRHLYRVDANNARPESIILDAPGLVWPNDWSRDGKYLLYGYDEGKTSRDLWALPMDTPNAKPFQYTHGSSLIKQGAFSPDGKFVAYTSDETGRYEIFVQPFPDASQGKWVISQTGGVQPLWSRDGRELFYFSGQKMMKVDVHVKAGAFSADVPRDLFSAPVPIGYSNDSHRWQLSPDANRFLVLIPSSGVGTAFLDVVVNWEQLLKP